RASTFRATRTLPTGARNNRTKRLSLRSASAEAWAPSSYGGRADSQRVDLARQKLRWLYTNSYLMLLPIIAPLDDIVDLPRQLVGQRRHIEEDAVIIDGIGDVVLYNEPEYCYIACFSASLRRYALR
ncbi:MAG: hypothetical protein ACKPKO_47365, partial [Candidatus Fonsibacter sp.]